jgi:predicted RNase H-like nuclease (RuvC/YqgF family)
MPLPLLAPLLIKGFCALCITGGTCYCVKKVADSYGKHSKRQKEKLALKGKSLEEAREDNKKAREEEKKLRDELEKQEDENKKIENELEQARNKANDSTLSEEERAQ